MSAKLNVVVTDCGADLLCGTTTPTTATSTPARSPSMTAPITLSPQLGSRSRSTSYEFAVQLDASANNNYQGDNSVVPFTWDAN